MKYDTLHETVIRDVLDILSDTKQAADKSITPSSRVARSGSISKATSGLTLVFPVIGSTNNSLETNTMVVKAVERQAVSLLQIAFSAFNLTNAADATEFIKQFHTNLSGGKLSLDQFIDIMDDYVQENGLVPRETRGMYNAVLEDLRNLSYHFADDVSESSINQFKVRQMGFNRVVIKEELSEDEKDAMKRDEHEWKGNQQYYDYMGNVRSDAKDKRDAEKHKWDKEDRERNIARDKRIDKRLDMRNDIQNQKDMTDVFKNQILSSDVKKINEMVPTMMIVNFITVDKSIEQPISRQVVIGVKAKFYPADSQDVVNKIITKHVDGNLLLKLVKASTREISFVKDFLFAIDNAKLSAVANSKHGSRTNKLLKVLERRALGGKIRKTFKLDNAFKAISTLVISKDEADYIMQENKIDVTNPRIMRPIMEKLNLMMFIIADESSESIQMIMDSGDDVYETLSFSQLEREASDSSSKKAINLMTKMVR